MVRLEPILTDPEEDRQHNKIGAAMLGAFIGGVMGLVVGATLVPFTWFWLGITSLGGAFLVAPIGYWLGESFVRFIGECFPNDRRWDPFDLDD